MASDRQFSWRRSLAWAVSLALHLGLLVAMTLPREAAPPNVVVDIARSEAVVPVDLVLPAERAPVVPRPAPTPDEALSASTPPPRDNVQPAAAVARAVDRKPSITEDVPPPAAMPVGTASARVAPAPVARTIAYLDDEARALLPLEDLDAATPQPRERSYHTPGNGIEDDVFYRPRALDPNPSRFAHAWQPRRNLVDGWLGRLVEKATGTVSIPLNPKFNLVCVTVAGASGSCMIVRNGGTGVIVQRPPTAPWERSNRVQCRELRQALAEADEAVELAHLLDRLSALCRGEGADEGEDSGGAASVEASVRNDEARREAGLP